MRWVCDSQKSVVCAIGIVMAGTGFRSRSTNRKPQKAGFPKLRRCHGSTSPSLANMHILLSVIKSFPFLASPSASLGYSCFSYPLLPLTFSFQFSSFISFHLSFRSYEFISELFLPSFLLAVLYQLLACSSWQFHDSILLVLLPTGPLGLFLCPLPLASYVGTGVRMHIC